MKSIYLTTLSLALGLFASASGAQDLATLVEQCNDCHGNDGVSQWSDVPTIAGIPEYVHADNLFFFRDNERPCAETEYKQGDTSRPATTMCEVVADLDDAMLEDLALHYFELPFVAAQQEFDAGLAAAGKAVHDELCDKCHSDGGSNPDDEAGILSGQWMGYLKNSFAEYASGDREQDKKMAEKMDALSDADVDALVHYYASQQ
jgi:sulfide dehydrogenase cytochrome subunit